MTEQFNAGDEVYVYSTGLTGIRKGVITRVTKTQAIIDRGRYEQRFNRVTGRQVGSGDAWSIVCISKPTPALDELWHQDRVRSAARLLSEAAKTGDEGVTRKAYATWLHLVGEEKS